jgi:hypothetical protein
MIKTSFLPEYTSNHGSFSLSLRATGSINPFSIARKNKKRQLRQRQISSRHAALFEHSIYNGSISFP